MKLKRLFPIGFLASFLLSFLASGQDSQEQVVQRQDLDYMLNVEVQLVQLPVSVVDKQGRLIDGLARDRFQIFEDGVQQQISLFKHEDIPLSVGLVIDNSGSMRNKRERVNSAALTFARESNPEDETFIVTFDNDAYLEQDFTGSIDDLIATLSHLDTRGETALYDAVNLSVNHLQRGKRDKKALLLISDGEDNSSKYDLGKVVEALRKSKVTLYAIGLLQETDQHGDLFKTPSSKKAKEALQKFAEVTGGQAYFPKSLDEVPDLCKHIAHDLRSHYTIGYTPSNKKLDGSWRTVKVKVNAPTNSKAATARTKPGYYAPRSSEVSPK